MHSRLEDPSHQESISVLLGLGVTTDEQQVRAVLERHKWDANAAATELLSEPVPQLTITYPGPVPPNAAPPTWTAAKETSVTAYEDTRSVDISVPGRGALNSSNSRTFLPPRVVPPSNLKKSDTYIDLTGDDEDEELRKAVAASLQGTDQGGHHGEGGVVLGPKNRGETTPLQPMRGLSHDEQLLSRALEASLTTSINADVYPEVLPWENRRQRGCPVTVRTKDLNHVHITLLLQALFAVPQLRDAVARWRRNKVEESTPEVLNHPLLNNTHQAYHTMECLQKVFALIDRSEQASENIDAAIELLPPRGQLHPNSPGDDMKGLYDLSVALLFEVVSAHHDKVPKDPDTGLQPRLLISRAGYEEKDIFEPPGIDVVRGKDLATLDVITSSGVEVNTLESAIFNHLLNPPIKSFLVRRASVVAVRVNRFDVNNSNVTPLRFPKRLFLDPFLWENRDLVLGKVQEIEHAQDHIEKIGKISQQFSPREDRDPVADLKQTIHYLENVADTGGDEKRAKHLEVMAGKLKSALAQIQQELENCGKQMSELRDSATTLLNIPELQKHPYDLRAVLVHDGLVGRDHSYTYLRDSFSGDWYKSCDASATRVPEETVFSDAAGLHLNSGPYFFLYSEAIPDSDTHEPPSLAWPPEILDDVAVHNSEFQRQLYTSKDVAVGQVRLVVDSVMSVDLSDTESGQASHGSSRLPSPGTSPQVSEADEPPAIDSLN